MNKDRDMEAIALFCKKFNDYCDNVADEARRMAEIALTAADSLRDDVGQAATGKVLEFAKELIRIVESGREPILELEKNNLQMVSDMEAVKRLIR